MSIEFAYNSNYISPIGNTNIQPHNTVYNSNTGSTNINSYGNRGSSSTPSTLGSPAVAPIYPPALPISSFIYSLKANIAVYFTNNSINAVRFLWDFGDGQQSSQQNPIHIFNTIGTYTVKLRAYNAAGDYVDSSQNVIVTNLIPAVNFSIVSGGFIQYLTDTSTNIDSNAKVIDWGDGTSEATDSQKISHTYSANGTYTIKLTRGGFVKTSNIIVDTEIQLSCNSMSGATGYKWEKSADGLTGWVQFADTAVPSVGVTYALYNIDSSIINYFRVKAYNNYGLSDWTSAINIQCNV